MTKNLLCNHHHHNHHHHRLAPLQKRQRHGRPTWYSAAYRCARRGFEVFGRYF